ncbi:hypothetical protein [Streptomyces sp. NBC_01803]|uniref:hypothetical protein n=1 Tax=Streptomyces sp. NBC_01803 TaxID=2975946 RepID=UPI003FA379EC
MTRPAPSRERAEVLVIVRELRTVTERPGSPPEAARHSRPETERRENCERDEPLPLPNPLPEPSPEKPPEPPENGPPLSALRTEPVTPVATEPIMPSGETTGASPQTPQYSSPPPMSSYVPEQSGR